jgi:DNA-binding NarL/FixJ family response regulator
MNFREPQQQVRLGIADYSPIFRDYLRRFLEMEPDHKVIGEGSNGAGAVQVVRQLKPDILLLNLHMSKQRKAAIIGATDDSMEALRELSNPANPTPVRVILLTAYIEQSQIVEALQLGARGVVLKTDATEVLFKAIQTVMAGEYWVGREQFSNLEQCLRTLMQSIDDEARRRRDQARRLKELSPRELETVSAVVSGYSNQEIAEYFKISEDTVKQNLGNLFDKLGVSSRLELALLAVHKVLPLKPIE